MKYVEYRPVGHIPGARRALHAENFQKNKFWDELSMDGPSTDPCAPRVKNLDKNTNVARLPAYVH